MADDAAKQEWILRVLGVDLGDGATLDGPLLPVWLDAKEQADLGIAALQQKLRGRGHPDLARIAEFGLNGITDRLGVGLMVTLREADAPGADAAARGKAAAAVAGFQTFLDTDPRVKLIGANPFGAQADLAGTLGRALGQLGRALAA